MKYRIGIYDKDLAYCTRLMEYINMNKEYLLHSICFSDAEALLESVDKNRLDLVLYGQSDSLMGIIRERCKIMRLADVDEEQYVGERYLYKYQRADVLIRDIVDCLDIELDKTIESVVFYGVYSPVGRCGKTSFSLGICCNYTRSLYVGMNSFIGSTIVTDAVFEQSERFFYQLLTHNESIITTIEDILSNRGGEYGIVYGMRNFADYKQLTAADFTWLRRLLLKHNILTRVVFDVGIAILSDLNILNEFDQVFVPCISDEYAKRRMHHFQLLIGDCCSELHEKIMYVEIPLESYDGLGMRDYVRRNVR